MSDEEMKNEGELDIMLFHLKDKQTSEDKFDDELEEVEELLKDLEDEEPGGVVLKFIKGDNEESEEEETDEETDDSDEEPGDDDDFLEDEDDGPVIEEDFTDEELLEGSVDLSELDDFTRQRLEKRREDLKKKDTRGNIIFLIVMVVIIIAAFIAGLILRDKREKEKDSKTPEITPTVAVTAAPEEPEEDFSWWEERDVTATGYELGDRVIFGSYPQSADGLEEPIAWKVIALEEGRALLLSEYVLDSMAYSEKGIIQWENSDLRAYLNGEFINNHFANYEQERMIYLEIENEDNPSDEYNTTGGHDTDDFVFLLSYEDAEDYAENIDFQAEATPYAIKKGIARGTTKYVTYWLRSPGCTDISLTEPGYAGSVDATGSVKYYGNDSTYTNIGVRPALWVSVNDIIY